MREKLIDLLGCDMCQDLCCCECEYETDDKGCNEELKQRMADHLIAHGVTFAKDINVPSKWIPVTERLPDHFGVFIVAIREPGRVRVGKDCADFDPFAKTWLPSLCWDKGYKVTHWMELPEPPKEGE